MNGGKCAITMVPKCECGYIFERLALTPETATFEPCNCPECGKYIGSIAMPGVGTKNGRLVFAEQDNQTISTR